MRFLTLTEVLYLHRRLLDTTGGAEGVRDLRIVDAALAAPKATFDDADLYPGIFAKAAALGYALIQGHAFLDGNKRIGHAAMLMFLRRNGYDLNASVDEQERVVLAIASGKMARHELGSWLEQHAFVRDFNRR